MIPKVIHYCWFGKKEKPELVQRCIQSWKILEQRGYRFIEWNETNCDFTETSYLKDLYNEGKYAFVSDYYRLKSLYEYGGIYLDTDMFVFKSFDNLLDCDFFAGYSHNYWIDTGIIACCQGNSIIYDLLDQYNKREKADILVNNFIITDAIKNAGIKINGEYISKQIINGEKVCIYDKNKFKDGYIWGKSYSMHLAFGSWYKPENAFANRLKLRLIRHDLFKVLSIIKHVNTIKEEKRYIDYINSIGEK